MATTPDVQVIAHPTGQAELAPRSNSALQLASALSDVSDTLPGFLNALGTDLRAKQQAKAKADAMQNSGLKFADAVRAGKIERTANPWYIQQYEQSSAEVRGQADVSKVIADSQTWDERNDPSKYSQRLSHEVGALAQQYPGIDQAKGFQAAAQPAVEQALNNNTEYNVQRINQEHVQNTTQLMSQALQDTYKASPKASPADFYKAIEGQHQAWIHTGGTEQQFNAMTRGAFVSAAEGIGNADFLDNLKYDRGGGKGSIYNIVAANGDPWSGDIEQAKYRIDRMNEIVGMGAVRQRQSQIELQGYDVQRWAYAKYGWDLVSGKVPLQQITAEAAHEGFNPEGVQAFLKLEAADLSSNNTYMRAQTQQYTLDPNNQQKILHLRTVALKDGWSNGLENAVLEEVRNGMDESVANDILAKADSTSKYTRSEAKADAREARSEESSKRSQRFASTREFKQSVEESIASVDVTLQGVGDKALLSPKTRQQVRTGSTDAGNAWLRSHPDDYAGAQAKVEDYLDRYAKLRLSRLRQGPAGATLQQANKTNPRAR